MLADHPLFDCLAALERMLPGPERCALALDLYFESMFELADNPWTFERFLTRLDAALSCDRIQ
jgi:hypothetical protein